jgi:hypothetical protein
MKVTTNRYMIIVNLCTSVNNRKMIIMMCLNMKKNWINQTLSFLINIIIAIIKNKIGIINVTISSTNGIVTKADIKNKKPDKILIFIEMRAKNEINKHIVTLIIPILFFIIAMMMFIRKDKVELVGPQYYEGYNELSCS